MTKYDVAHLDLLGWSSFATAIRKEPPPATYRQSTPLLSINDKLPFPSTTINNQATIMVAIIRSLRFAGKRVAATPLSAKPVQRSSFHFTALRAAGKESALS
jgi:hypothetical protein